jgi:hypothetical protein
LKGKMRKTDNLLFLVVPIWFWNAVELVIPCRARVSIPIKVVLRIAVALVIQTIFLAGRAVCEWDMIVSNVVEEVNFFFLQHQRSRNRMHGCVAPTLVEKAAGMIEGREIVNVGLGPKPVEIAYLKV